MQILDTKKIKFLIYVLCCIVLILIISIIFKLRKNDKSNLANNEIPPILQPAPDNLTTGTIIAKRLSNGTYYYNDDGDIFISTDNGKDFIINKDGDAYINVDGKKSNISKSDENIIYNALKEINDDKKLQNYEEKNIKSKNIESEILFQNDNNPKQKNNSTNKNIYSSISNNSANNTTSNLKRIPKLDFQQKIQPEPTKASKNNDNAITLDTNALSNSFLQTDYNKQNSQNDKKKFLEEFTKKEKSSYLLTNNDIAPGTIIPITLITGINSDLPGEIIAQIDTNIYDTLSGDKLLLAKGTKLIASYDSQITFGQGRILIAWTQLIRSDGLILTLPGFQGIDNMGHSGYVGKIDNHYSDIFKTSLLSSLIELTSSALSSVSRKNNATEIIVDSFSQSLTTPAQDLIQKTINRQPTITIKPGTRCKMLVNSTLHLTEQASNNLYFN